jgi:hypothetical protein
LEAEGVEALNEEEEEARTIQDGQKVVKNRLLSKKK